MWLVLHHFVWDGYETRPHEEVNPNGIFELLTDPDLVSRNIVANLYMSAGMTIMMSVAMALPMLLASYYNSYDETGGRLDKMMAPEREPGAAQSLHIGAQFNLCFSQLHPELQ